jgi:hypothetical protein
LGGLQHRTTGQGGEARIRLQTPSDRQWQVLAPSFWSGGSGLAWDLRVTDRVPLALQIEGGLSNNRLDLTDLPVHELRLEGGLSATRVRLPARAGLTRVRIEAGLSSVRIDVPEGVAARIRVEGGLASTDIDTRRFPRLASVYQSPDYETAENKVDMEIEQGLGSVMIR